MCVCAYFSNLLLLFLLLLLHLKICCCINECSYPQILHTHSHIHVNQNSVSWTWNGTCKHPLTNFKNNKTKTLKGSLSNWPLWGSVIATSVHSCDWFNWSYEGRCLGHHYYTQKEAQFCCCNIVQSHTSAEKCEPLWACFTCWNVATVSVCLWSTPYPLCIFHSWEQEDRRPTHSLSWPYHWQAGSTGYLPTGYLTRKDGQGELLVEVVVVEDLGALGTKEVDEEGGVRDLLVQVLKAQPPSSSYNKP